MSNVSNQKGLRLQIVRKHLNLTQKELTEQYSKFLDNRVEQSTLSRIEQDTAKIPPELLEFLYVSFNANPIYILTGESNVLISKETTTKQDKINFAQILSQYNEIKSEVKQINSRLLDIQLSNNPTR